MKKLFILFLAAGLLTACNNNNPLLKDENTAKDREKDDRKRKDDNTDKDDRDDRYIKDDDDSKVNNLDGWTKSDRNEWRRRCEDELSDNPQAKQICACVIEKAERKYPNVKDVEAAADEEGERMIKECSTRMGGDDGYTDDREDDRPGVRDPEEKMNEGNWSNLQRKKFIEGCATTARQQQGFTAAQANAYCDCMTRKVEKKYTFQQAARMTAEDFNTREWTNAAKDCISGN
jgi:hypothetical protein